MKLDVLSLKYVFLKSQSIRVYLRNILICSKKLESILQLLEWRRREESETYISGVASSGNSKEWLPHSLVQCFFLVESINLLFSFAVVVKKAECSGPSLSFHYDRSEAPY